MGMTAENVAEDWGLTRQQLDEFAAWSQNKCEKAQAEGRFKDEIVPVEVKKKKETIIFDTDEGPRKGVTVEGISKLRLAFKEAWHYSYGNLDRRRAGRRRATYHGCRSCGFYQKGYEEDRLPDL